MFFNWFSKNHVINITKDSNEHFIVLFCDRFERDNMMSKLSGQLDFRVSKYYFPIEEYTTYSTKGIPSYSNLSGKN